MEQKLEKEKLESDLNSWSGIATAEVFVNNVNHALIAISMFYMTWYSWQVGFNKGDTNHAWFSTLGYQLFMAEGIMAAYNRNTFTMGLKHRAWKLRAHWMLQVVGCGFVLYGIPLEIYHRSLANRSHFRSIHAITGLVSFIFLFLSLLSGMSALFSVELRSYIKPLFSKAVHNFLSSTCYVVGMVSTFYGYYTKRWFTRKDPGGMRDLMLYFCIISTVITMIGPMKTAWNQFRNK